MPDPADYEGPQPIPEDLLPREVRAARGPWARPEDLRPDPDYVCGASECDDPACNTHGSARLRVESPESFERGWAVPPDGFDLDAIVGPTEHDERTSARLDTLLITRPGAAEGLPTDRVLTAVALECQRAHEQHGAQLDFPDVPEGEGAWQADHHARAFYAALRLALPDAAVAKASTRDRARAGTCTWGDVLAEEVAEAVEAAAHQDPAALAEELLQVAAVALRWRTAVLTRGAGSTTVTDGFAR